MCPRPAQRARAGASKAAELDPKQQQQHWFLIPGHHLITDLEGIPVGISTVPILSLALPDLLAVQHAHGHRGWLGPILSSDPPDLPVCAASSAPCRHGEDQMLGFGPRVTMSMRVK